MTRHSPIAALLLAALLLCACGDNRTPQPEPRQAEALCIPDLDGSLSAAEFALVAGQVGHYDVSGLRDVDSAGDAGDGEPRWDLDWSHDDDDRFRFEVQDARDMWFSERIPDATYARFDDALVALPSDVEQRYQLILGKDDEATWLVGLASTERDPADEGATWVLYDEPAAIHRFPMEPGRSWVSDGEATGATLPVPGTPGITLREDRIDTYEISVTDVGVADLGDYRFDAAFRLEQRVTTAFPGNPLLPTTVQAQVQYFAECGGEIARLTARQNDTQTPLAVAQEARRARLD